MKRPTPQSGRAALDLIEDAVHLLRATPATAWTAYYAGAVPFALGLLYFWTDMSCGARAGQRCAAAALGVALLFLWLKCWQSVFAAGLRARLAGAAAPQWSLSRLARLALVQGVLQPSRLLVLPLALIATLPFAWVAAFYENVTVLGDGTEAGVRAVGRRAAGQAKLWPKQNHLLLGLLALAALVGWLNAVVAVAVAPHLLKMLLGIETGFARAGIWVIFNTTFLAATVALAWLALDPLLKAVYALRCFHGEARTDGADLLAELAAIRSRRQGAATGALLLLLLFLPAATRAAAPPPAPPAPAAQWPAVPTEQMDAAVQKTLAHDKYDWRLPRENTSDETSATRGWIATFLASLGHTLAGVVRAISDWIGDLRDWLKNLLHLKPKNPADAAYRSFDWADPLRWFAFALVLLAGAALALLVLRLWRTGRRRRAPVLAEVVAAAPDLRDENITAAQLPEDEWLRLAREKLDQGDRRLAMRAFYLATLAHLAAREIVGIARFKSNHDYETEVNRRARGQAELRAAFAANVRAFDRAWYGLYEVTADALAGFQSNFDRIRAC